MQPIPLASGLTGALLLACSIGAQAPPLSGVAFPVANGRDGSVAYNPRTDQYFAAFTVTLPGAKQDNVHGQLFAADGTLGTYVRFNSVSYGSGHQVAAIQGNDAFLIGYAGAFYYGNYVLLTALELDGGVRGPSRLDGANDVFSLDVGGEASPANDGAIVVVDSAVFGTIRAYDVDTAALTAIGNIDLTTSATADSVPRIAAAGGDLGRYLITWQRQDPTAQGDVYAAIVDRDLRVLVPEFPIATSASNERSPEVDGDGTHWVVAYVTTEAGASRTDVACRTVTYDTGIGGAKVGAERIVAGQPGVNEAQPTVAWLGESFLVGFARQFSSGDWDLYATSVEALSCGPCEGEFPIATGPFSERRLQLASERGAGGSGDEAVALWWRQRAAATNLTSARAFRADDGAVRDRRGGCGLGGQAIATCAAVGAPSFGLGLRNAERSAPAWLLLGSTAAPFRCSGCRLVPVPLVAVPFTTDPRGDAALVAPLTEPSLVGQTLFAQWLVAAIGGCPSIGLSFSNALEVTIE
ncbi:MAG: hypothetical protein AAF628_36115 [Planctomycetota bacterium]